MSKSQQRFALRIYRQERRNGANREQAVRAMLGRIQRLGRGFSLLIK